MHEILEFGAWSEVMRIRGLSFTERDETNNSANRTSLGFSAFFLVLSGNERRWHGCTTMLLRQQQQRPSVFLLSSPATIAINTSPQISI
ncbi:hypothetical protein MRB53_012186 [Persea americana]|uniref:Uncharacterized protein n=1 Tax=Persea americana TaxID=3435 RepID=A0ACC2LY11_PERAE|nr:hypothetical protein MRB53_012186 [Persea americana]